MNKGGPTLKPLYTAIGFICFWYWVLGYLGGF